MVKVVDVTFINGTTRRAHVAEGKASSCTLRATAGAARGEELADWSAMLLHTDEPAAAGWFAKGVGMYRTDAGGVRACIIDAHALAASVLQGV